MPDDWWKLALAFIGGVPIWGSIGYVLQRHFEKRKHTEALARDTKILEAIEKFIEVNAKAKEANFFFNVNFEAIPQPQDANKFFQDLLNAVKVGARLSIAFSFFAAVAANVEMTPEQRKEFGAMMKRIFKMMFKDGRQFLDDPVFATIKPMAEQFFESPDDEPIIAS